MEEWYHAHDYNLPRQDWNKLESRVEESTKDLLSILHKYDVKAVFFILGSVAESNPRFIKHIQDQGHVIACHGFWHEKLHQLTRDALKNDIHMTKNVLESITGEPVHFYRAPSWTFDHKTEYLKDILIEESFKVDSSLQPFRTPLSGVNGAKTGLHRLYSESDDRHLMEFPVPLCKLGPFKVPFSGGFYFRVLPISIVKFCLSKTLKNQDCFLYFHPWEFDVEQPRPKASWLIQFIHHYGIKRNMKKLEDILQNFKFSDPKMFGIEDHAHE